jgi:hypothetical protein
VLYLQHLYGNMDLKKMEKLLHKFYTVFKKITGRFYTRYSLCLIYKK